MNIRELERIMILTMIKPNQEASILIVDDDPDLLDMYQDIMQIDGVKIITATSGDEAISLCKSNPSIKIILSDSNMGEMSGMELLHHLRSYYKTMPVFYLLTGAFDVSEEEVTKAGGAGLVLKPFDLEEILAKMKRDINLKF
jgi:DNA-binding response OmpR family regulator